MAESRHESLQQTATGGVFHRLVRSLSNPHPNKPTLPQGTPVDTLAEEPSADPGIKPSGLDNANSVANTSAETAKSVEKNAPEDIEAVEQRGQMLDAIALIKNFVHISPKKAVSVDSIQSESAAQPSTEEAPVSPPVVDGDHLTNIATKPNAFNRMKSLVHIGVKKDVQEMVDASAPATEAKAVDPVPETDPPFPKTLIDDEVTENPAVDDAAVKAGKLNAFARVKGFIHIGGKRPALTQPDKPVDGAEPAILVDVPAQGVEETKPIFSKTNVLSRVKSLVHSGGKKTDGEPKLAQLPDNHVDEAVAAAVASVKEPEEVQPRSITPAQLAELVDASIASELTSPNSPATSIPTIEAVLSSATASAKDVEIGSPESGSDVNTLIVPPASELAQRIFDLTSALPAPPKEIPHKVKVSSPKKAKDGKPIPPAGASEFIKDEQFAQYLRTPIVMNGSTTEDGIDDELGVRKSVWDVLDAMHPPGTTPETGLLDGEDDDDDDVEVQIIGDGSVMLYFPLIPQKDSEVRIADSILVPVSGASEVNMPDEGSAPVLQTTPGVISSGWPWPFPGWPGRKTGPSAPTEEQSPPKEEEPAKKPNKLKKKKPVQRKVWVPSQTELSVQASWWGFRIFLPPPILVTLSEKSAEVSKVATLITTALTWLSTNIPIESFPGPLQPVVLLLTRLIPFIGYLGAFIAWSISSIKAFDKGSGVKLTATWLLPIALVPGAMDPVPAPGETPPVTEPSGEDRQTEPTEPPKADPVPPGTSPTPTAPETEIPTPSVPEKAPDGTPAVSNPGETAPTTEPSPPPEAAPGSDEKGKHRPKWSFGGLF